MLLHFFRKTATGSSPCRLLNPSTLNDVSTAPSSPAKPTLIGIAGCSGSGKTTLARELATQLNATLFPLDFYYRDLSQFPLDARDKRNFDHPDSLESELFIKHLRDLADDKPIQRPVYDFKTHSRVPDAFTTITPCAFVIVEGILALHYAELVPLYALSVYVDAPHDVCLTRRIRRDIRERGRSEASVREQYEAAVRPMADQFILPSRSHATLTVSGTESLDWSIEGILRELRRRSLLS
jgi:uridine kinase